MKRGLLVAALPVLLGGCLPILPPAIQLATTGLSGFAFLATGKSTTDHLISAAVDEDCSLLRVAVGDMPCHEYTSGEEKPLTELVAYYPGDSDDWIDRKSIPAGVVSGKTILTVSIEEDPDVRVRDSWPGRQESDVLLVEAPVSSGLESETTKPSGAVPEMAKDLKVAGFVPVEATLELEPLKLKSEIAPSALLALPIAAEVSWAVEPRIPVGVAAATPAHGRAVEAVERTTMPVLPVPRPSRLKPTQQGAQVIGDPSEVFAEAGLVGSEHEHREAFWPILLQNRFASNQGAAEAPPTIMSVRLKGSLLHRVTGGAFAGYGAGAGATSFEPVFGLTR